MKAKTLAIYAIVFGVFLVAFDIWMLMHNHNQQIAWKQSFVEQQEKLRMARQEANQGRAEGIEKARIAGQEANKRIEESRKEMEYIDRLGRDAYKELKRKQAEDSNFNVDGNQVSR